MSEHQGELGNAVAFVGGLHLTRFLFHFNSFYLSKHRMQKMNLYRSYECICLYCFYLLIKKEARGVGFFLF